MKLRGGAGAFAMASIVIALAVLVDAAYELIRWSSDRNAWAEQQCQDSLRFEVCVGDVSAQGALHVVRGHIVIIGVVVGTVLLAYALRGKRESVVPAADGPIEPGE